MAPGSAVRNVVVAVVYLFTFPLFIFLFPLFLGVFAWRNTSGWADSLSSLPGVSPGGGIASGVAGVVWGGIIWFVVMAALGAGLGGGGPSGAGPGAGSPPAMDSGGTSTAGGAQAASTPTATQVPASTATPPPPATPSLSPSPTPSNSHTVGESFTVGSGAQSIEYMVASASVTDHVGTESFGEDADGIFVVVELRMTNVGNESLDLSTAPFRMVDSQGREFEVDTGALVYLEDAIVFEQLHPGLEKRGQIVFDVAAGDTYRLRIDPAGMFSGAESHTVEIGTVEE